MDLNSGSAVFLPLSLCIHLGLYSRLHLFTFLNLKLDLSIQCQIKSVCNAVSLADIPWGLRALLETAEGVRMAWLRTKSCSRHQIYKRVNQSCSLMLSGSGLNVLLTSMIDYLSVDCFYPYSFSLDRLGTRFCA